MQLLITLAIVLTLTTATAREHQAIAMPYLRLLAVLACMIMPWYCARRWLDRSSGNVQTGRRWEGRRALAERIFVVIWLACTLIELWILKWDSIVRIHFGLSKTFLLDELLILIPVVLPWFGWWLVERAYDSSQPADGHGVLCAPEGIMPFCWQNLRQGFLLPLLPIMAIIAVDDLLEFLPSLAQHKSIFYWPILLAIPFAVPLFLRFLWDVRPLSAGPLAERIRRILNRAQTEVSGVLIWSSHRRIVNAAVAGLRPGPRYLFLSDGLIERLSADEVEAVVAHEVAHLRKGHLQFILLSLVLTLLAMMVFMEAIRQQARYFVAADDPELVIVLFVMMVWLFFHRVHARMLEHHADLEACRILGDSNSRIDESSVARFSHALRKVATPNRGYDWWHPTIEHRIALLDTFLRNQEYRERFDDRIVAVHRLIGGFTILLALAAAGLALIE
jgi:Zn-dependent protease with chaperone function